MNVEDLRDYCLAKLHVTESFPFDEHTLVFKVANKVFAITGLNRLPHAVNLKCNPDYALELREQYSGVEPGYHMNKKHWNTVVLEEDVSVNELKEMIDHSYNLVVKSLTKKMQKELGFID